MITSRRKLVTAERLLRKLRVERRLLERAVLFNPRNLPQAQRLEEVRSLIPELERKTEEYCELIEGKRNIDLGVLENVSELLVSARVRAGLTQRQLSKIVCIPRQQITKYEKEGFQCASLRNIQRIAVALTTAMEKRWDNVPRIDSREGDWECAPDAVSGEDFT